MQKSKRIDPDPAPNPKGNTPPLRDRFIAIWNRLMVLVTGTIYWSPKQALIVAGVLGFAVLAGFLILISLLGMRPTPPPPSQQLPIASGDQVLDYLKNAGIAVTDNRKMDSLSPWTAQQGVRFSVNQGTSKANFVLLTYGSADKAGIDAFRISGLVAFKNWSFVQSVNLLLLADPNTSPALIHDIERHLTEKMIAPYRSMMATPTARPLN